MPKADISFKDLKLDANGLIPVVVQDYVNGEVLMLAYMNEEAFNKKMCIRDSTDGDGRCIFTALYERLSPCI